jgi:hypothetical protein
MAAITTFFFNSLPFLYIFLNLFYYYHFFAFCLPYSQRNSLDIVFKLLKSIIGRGKSRRNKQYFLAGGVFRSTLKAFKLIRPENYSA